jgi:hypothetical protein
MTDLGEISWILGIHLTRDRDAGTISLSQAKYIGDILDRFGYASIRPISTLSLVNESLLKSSTPEIEVQPYQSAVGALMYPSLGT